jgi:hypothetical protein
MNLLYTDIQKIDKEILKETEVIKNEQKRENSGVKPQIKDRGFTRISE